jgi:hypothetical protein
MALNVIAVSVDFGGTPGPVVVGVIQGAAVVPFHRVLVHEGEGKNAGILKWRNTF